MTEEEQKAAQTAKELAIAKAEAATAAGSAEGAVFNAGGFGFPLSAEAAAALQRFGTDSSVVRVVLQIAREAETIELHSLADTGDAVAGLAAVGDDEREPR